MEHDVQERKRILIVDDDPLILRMFERMVKRNGYDVEIARSGEEVFSSLYRHTPDLILLDIMMPRLNGVETLKILKSDEKTKHIPVIILSNLGDKPDEMVAAKEFGAFDYLVKANTEFSVLAERIASAIAETSKPHS